MARFLGIKSFWKFSLLLFVVLGFLIIVTLEVIWFGYVSQFMNSSDKTFKLDKQEVLFQRGVAICSGDEQSMIVGTSILIEEIRVLHRSNVPIAVFHCDEFSYQTIAHFERGYDNVSVINLCKRSTLSQKKRLRGWFCKPAALASSIFNETLMLDIDSLWFETPLTLFHASGYRDTGALFFRDRFLFESDTSVDRRSLRYHEVKQFVELHSGVQITPSVASRLSHGLALSDESTSRRQPPEYYSYFWNYGRTSHDSGNVTHPRLRHLQESSAVVFDRTRLPRTLQWIERLIPSFQVGYGDKELYWLAATIAQERFAWEQFIAGAYGDCGEILHFDDQGKPLYLNAQYLAQDVSVGKNLESQITKPVPASKDLKLFELGRFNAETAGRCDACKFMGCESTPDHINQKIKNTQYRILHFPHQYRSPFHKIKRSIESWMMKLLI